MKMFQPDTSFGADCILMVLLRTLYFGFKRFRGFALGLPLAK